MADGKKVCAVGMGEISGVLTAVLDSGADVKLTVTGNSMYPLFRSGIDSVVLSKIPVKKYSIILYKRNNGKYILHRVVRVKGDELYLAGDFETEIEYPIYMSQVVAGVKGFYRGERFISCSNPFYWLYSIAWVFILPYRRGAVRLLRRMSRFRRFLRRRKGEKKTTRT